MTTVVQSTYRPQIAPAVVGLVADETSAEVGSRQVETSAGVGFGLAVSQGTGDRGAILGGSAFIGVSVRDITLDSLPIDPLSSTEAVRDVYPQYANMGVLSRGHIWVTANGGGTTGVKAGDALYYDTTSGNFTNSASGEAASGSATFTQQPAVNDTLLLAGDTWTFLASGAVAASLQVNIGATLGDTIRNLATVLNASSSTDTTKLVYSAYPPSPGGAGEGSGANTLMYADKVVGTAGNALTVSSSTTGATVSGAGGALAGGTAAATAVTSGYWASSAIAGQLAKISLGIQR